MRKSWIKTLRIALACALVFATAPVPAQDAPSPDAAIDQLLKLDPAQLVEKIKALKAQQAQQAAEAKQHAEEAAKLEAELASKQQQVEGVMNSIKVLGEKYFPAPEPAPAEMAAEEKQAKMEKKDVKNFLDHVQPILAQHCANCHNEDRRKSGFAVTSFNLIMEGGSSGSVIQPGDPDNSRLMKLIAQAEEPVMPPSGEAIPADQIEVIRQWIAAGALMDKDSQPMAKAEKEEIGTMEGDVYIAARFADTPPLPEVTLASAQPIGQRGVIARAMDTSPTAPLMAVGANKQVLLVNTETLETLGALPFPEGNIFTLTFSVNGELLVVGGGEEGAKGIGAVYNVRTGERTGTYGQYYDTVLAADISPDHQFIALGGPNRAVRVYDAETAEELYKIDKHTEWIYAVKFTPDGEVLTTADRGGGMYVWQAKTGRYVEELRGHEGAIHALEYTYDSKVLASAGEDGTVQLWDTWKYSRIRSFQAHGVPVLNLDVNKESKILTTGQDAVAKLFNMEGKEEKKFGGLEDWGYTTCFSHGGGKVLAGNWKGQIHFWNSDSAELVTTMDTMPQQQS